MNESTDRPLYGVVSIPDVSWQVARENADRYERWAARLRTGRHFFATPDGLREILDPFGSLGPVVDPGTLLPVAGVAS